MDVNHSKPPKPELSFGGNGLEVTFMPPDGAAHAVVYVYDADGKKRFLDAGVRNKLLAPGQTGRVLSVRARHRQNVVVDDVGGAGEFSATVCYRSPQGFAFGPESPHSETVILGGMVKRVGAVAGQRELLGKTGQLVGKKGNHAQVDFGADLGGIHTVLQKYLEPVDADDDSEENARQSPLAHPPSA